MTIKHEERARGISKYKKPLFLYRRYIFLKVKFLSQDWAFMAKDEVTGIAWVIKNHSNQYSCIWLTMSIASSHLGWSQSCKLTCGISTSRIFSTNTSGMWCHEQDFSYVPWDGTCKVGLRAKLRSQLPGFESQLSLPLAERLWTR